MILHEYFLIQLLFILDQTIVIAASAAVSSVIICFIVMVAPVVILWIRVKNSRYHNTMF